MRILSRLIITLLLLPILTLSAGNASAQPAESLKVGLFVNPPFVIDDYGGFDGIAVELWEILARELGWEYDYVNFPTVDALIAATESGEIDVAVSNISITHARAERMDFTQPWLDGGNRIMVDSGRRHGFDDLIAGLSDAGFLNAYAWIALLIVFATLLLTLFDRRFDKSFPARWRDGVAESFYTVMSVVTSGAARTRKNLFGWVGRIWQALWLVCGVAIIAFVTSSVTSVMTTLSLASHINAFEDLSGKTVAVMSGTTQEEFVRKRGLAIRSYPGINLAIASLVLGSVDAIVHDAPVLEYYALTHPDQPVQVVGRLFATAKYGFALPRGSERTRPLTLAVLAAHDSGTIEKLRVRYFGADTQAAMMPVERFASSDHLTGLLPPR